METAPGHGNDPTPALSKQAGSLTRSLDKVWDILGNSSTKTQAKITVQQMLLLGAAMQNLWWLQAKFSLFN